MAGYRGYSMSNNAVSAYDDGEKPLSRWSKSDVISAIADELGVNESDIELKYPYRYYLKRTSWHHTSSKYNKTDFYSVSFDDEDIILTSAAELQSLDNWIEEVQRFIEDNEQYYEELMAFEPVVVDEDESSYYVTSPIGNTNSRYSKEYTTKERAITAETNNIIDFADYIKYDIRQRIEYIEKLKRQREDIVGKNRLHEKIVRINNTDIDTTGVNDSTTTHLYDESESNRKNFEKATSIEDRDDIDKDILKDRRDDTELPRSEDSKKMFLSESLFEEDNADVYRRYVRKLGRLDDALNTLLHEIESHELEEVAGGYNLDYDTLNEISKKVHRDFIKFDVDRKTAVADELDEAATRLRKPSPLFDDLFDEVYVRLINTPSDDVLKKSEHRHLLGKYSDAEEIVIDFEDGYSIIKVVTPIADDKLGYAREIAKEYEPYGVDTEYSKDNKFETLKFIIPEGDSPYDEKRMAEYKKKKSDKK